MDTIGADATEVAFGTYCCLLIIADFSATEEATTEVQEAISMKDVRATTFFLLNHYFQHFYDNMKRNAPFLSKVNNMREYFHSKHLAKIQKLNRSNPYSFW